MILLLASAILSNCRETGPLTLPKQNEVTKIEKLEGVLEENRAKAEIDDPDKIRQILSFIERNNAGWFSPWDTYPTPQITVVFRNSNSNPVLILWFGTNWVGGQASPISPKKAYLWKLDDSRLKELKQLIGITI
jgi:hypothetical protein